MKVLHYIPLLDSARAYLTDLSNQTDANNSSATYIVTLWADRTYSSSGRFIIYQMLKKPHRFINLVHLQNRFLQILYATMPDIVHIHGCWSYVTAKICLWAKNRNFKVVISPHGQLEKKVIEDHFWSKHFPQILLFQKRTIKRADALWAGTEQEAKGLRRLGWNKRIGQLSDIDDEVTLQTAYAAFYQKTVDTTYYIEMQEHEKEAFSALLHAGLADDEETHLLDGPSILNLRSLTVASWRRIFLMAHDQHVMHVMLDGVARMQLSTPRIDVANILRFPDVAETNEEPLPVTGLIHDSKRNKKRAYQIPNDEIRGMFYMLVNIRELLRDKRLSMRQLTDYYTYVRHLVIDESEAVKSLKSVGILPFAARLHQILHECLYLEHGFMPIAPVNDRKTETIRKKIHQICHF